MAGRDRCESHLVTLICGRKKSLFRDLTVGTKREEIPLDRVAMRPSFLGQSSDAPVVKHPIELAPYFTPQSVPNLDSTLCSHPSYGASSQRGV